MKTGLERLDNAKHPCGKAALLSHYAAVDSLYRNSLDVIMNLSGTDLRMVFGPQHGFRGETQDNMIEWDGYTHPRYGIPVRSLYGSSRKPDSGLLRGLDFFLVDLQDVGSRYYTYIYTMAYCLRACAEANVPVVVLDRPNPLGYSIVEGWRLEPEYESFVGLYSIPVRHALTIGELALLFAEMDGLPRPEVIEMTGWNGQGIPDGYQWVYPSPNMPTPEAALVYSGMCLLEATGVSEGRGTTRPFSVFGAPWLDGDGIAENLNGSRWMTGAVLRPHSFVPTFNKHSGEMCGGCEIHVTDSTAFRPLKAAFGILLELFRNPLTEWKEPPYEYEYDKMPIDILAGGSNVREAVDEGDEDRLLELCRGDVQTHREATSDCILYERTFES